ncbi:CNOT6L [Cordylochernes scorpioides]|uniref:CNOT6L n=1 Tax=Cordylochernes scorpioides TaxID=51811 RepID=A0ABY6LPH6_9ARAC|nr:CNOT6L [Cordylochernes scorpioides]
MESVKDEKRVGRPILHRNPEKVSQISNLIKENPRIGLRDIEEETGISKSLVGSIIKEDLQLKKTPSKFVPKMLSIQQKENRVEVAKKKVDAIAPSLQFHKRGAEIGTNWDLDSIELAPGPTKEPFEDTELEALLNEDSSQTQEELAETLEVTQQAISNRITVMGMVQKQGNWVPCELKPGNIERRICTCELLLKIQNRKGFFASNRDGGRKVDSLRQPKAQKIMG